MVAEGYGGKGITLGEGDAAGIAKVLQQAQAFARDGEAVLVNALIGKTDFRKGSISV